MVLLLGRRSFERKIFLINKNGKFYKLACEPLLEVVYLQLEKDSMQQDKPKNRMGKRLVQRRGRFDNLRI